MPWMGGTNKYVPANTRPGPRDTMMTGRTSDAHEGRGFGTRKDSRSGPLGRVQPQRVADPIMCCLGAKRGISGICFEEEGQGRRNNNWSYVGEGRGEYEKVHSYSYVGTGQGNFDRMELETTYYGWRLKKCVWCLCLLPLLAAAGFILTTVVRVPWPSFGEVEGREVDASKAESDVMMPIHLRKRTTGHTTLPFDCSTDAEQGGRGPEGWSKLKRFWCCQHVHRGCHKKTQATHPSRTPPDLHDCDLGFSDWKSSWSDEKKEWCCEHFARGCCKGCLTSANTSTPAGCNRTCIYQGQAASCETRIHHVATHKFAGVPTACLLAHDVVLKQCPVCSHCPADGPGCLAVQSPDDKPVAAGGTSTTTTTEFPFDCAAGRKNRSSKWSAGKQAWCCLHKDIGCPTTSTTTVTTRTTTPDLGCDSSCKYEGKSAKCKDRIQFAADHEFVGEHDACVSAHDLVLDQCKSCSTCTLAGAACVAKTTTVTVTTTTTRLACNMGCTYRGHSWTCSQHIRYISRHRFAKDPQACKKAHSLVLHECSSCSGCASNATGCVMLTTTTPTTTTPATTTRTGTTTVTTTTAAGTSTKTSKVTTTTRTAPRSTTTAPSTATAGEETTTAREHVSGKTNKTAKEKEKTGEDKAKPGSAPATVTLTGKRPKTTTTRTPGTRGGSTTAERRPARGAAAADEDEEDEDEADEEEEDEEDADEADEEEDEEDEDEADEEEEEEHARSRGSDEPGREGPMIAQGALTATDRQEQKARTTTAPKTTTTPATTVPKTTTTLATTAEEATTTKKPTTTKRRTTTEAPATSTPARTTKAEPAHKSAPPTTAAGARPGGCDSMCEYGGEAYSCGARLRHAVHATFKGSKNACQWAQGLVLQQCSSCSACKLTEIGCEAGPGAEQGAAEKEAATTARPPSAATEPSKEKHGKSSDGCDEECVVTGKSATCRSRFQDAVNYVFKGKSNACVWAQGLVFQQCPSCFGCPLSALGCNVSKKTASSRRALG